MVKRILPSFPLWVLILVILSCASAGEVKDKPALDVPYEPTSYGIAAEMIRMAEVTSGDRVYDLGCGDGRIVIMAARERGAKGVGVDLDPQRIKESVQNAKQAGVSQQVRFFEQDLFDADIRDATVVMLYLWPGVNLKLRPKLLKELQPGTRVVSHSHTMGEWEPDATRTVEGDSLYFFVVPANVTGTWQWSSAEGAKTFLHLTQKFQKVGGSILIGKETYPVIEGSVRGDTLLFSLEKTLPGKKEILSFEGRISGARMEGKTTEKGTGRQVSSWTAARDPSTIVPIAE
jgi:SAM-dependent methyltransferase